MPAAEPRAALLIIGAEVLSGKIDDANGPFLIRALRARGVQVVELRIVGDTVEEISRAVRDLLSAADYVFTTGGIGPTHDDVTIAGVADAFGKRVVRHPDLERMLRARHNAVNEARLKLAEIPEGASVHLGDGSFVPVVQIDKVTILPGVPSLMRGCFAFVAGTLKQGTAFHSRALWLCASESDIAQTLTDVQTAFPDVAIGSYPRFDLADHRVKVTMDGRDAARVNATFETLRGRLKDAWVVAEE